MIEDPVAMATVQALVRWLLTEEPDEPVDVRLLKLAQMDDRLCPETRELARRLAADLAPSELAPR